MDESQLYSRMNTAEARYNTLQQEMTRMKERIQTFKANFGVRELRDGAIEIDYDVFVGHLGLENWIELRQIGDARYGMAGAPGEKPRVRMQARPAYESTDV